MPAAPVDIFPDMFPELPPLVNELCRFREQAAAFDLLRFLASPEQADARARAAVDDSGLLPLAAAVSDRERGDMEEVEDLQSLRTLQQNLEQQIQGNPQFFDQTAMDLTTPLQRMSAECRNSPLRREDLVLKDMIGEHVGGVFSKLQKDSGNEVLMVDNYKRDSDEFARQIQRLSERLGAEPMVPDRANLEAKRVKLALDLLKVHQDHERVALSENTVPELLQRHRRSYEKQHAQQHQMLKGFGQQHEEKAKQCRQLMLQQQLFHQRRAAALERDRQLDVESEAASRRELNANIEEVRRLLSRSLGLMESIAESRAGAQAKHLEAQSLKNLMDEAQAQPRIEAERHEKLQQRYQQGAALLVDFDSWLQRSYGWLGSRVEKIRQRLADDLPAERRKFRPLVSALLEDLVRQRSELRWSMDATVEKMRKRTKDAVRLERIPGKREGAETKKDEVNNLANELDSLRRRFDELGESMQHIEEQLEPFGADGAEGDGGTWAGRFFYNLMPAHPVMSLPALQEMRSDAYDEDSIATQGSVGSSWFRSGIAAVPELLRRIRGKRPPSPMEAPHQRAPKRRRAIDDGAAVAVSRHRY